jgi:hypothetical protein
MFSHSGKHSIAIWTMYLCFEISRGGDHAKDVLFRGLAKIPCAKWYIILGFSKLAHMLSFDELESLYRLLDDKELRVHMNITELIAGKSGELTRSGNRPLRLT